MRYENQERIKSQSLFRRTMDVGMGLFYTAVGIAVIYMQSFGSLPMPAWIAFILGGMMCVGGAFRFYKGVRSFMPQKEESGKL